MPSFCTTLCKKKKENRCPHLLRSNYTAGLPQSDDLVGCPVSLMLVLACPQSGHTHPVTWWTAMPNHCIGAVIVNHGSLYISPNLSPPFILKLSIHSPCLNSLQNRRGLTPIDAYKTQSWKEKVQIMLIILPLLCKSQAEAQYTAFENCTPARIFTQLGLT